jgi:hypothetical protein
MKIKGKMPLLPLGSTVWSIINNKIEKGRIIFIQDRIWLSSHFQKKGRSKPVQERETQYRLELDGGDQPCIRSDSVYATKEELIKSLEADQAD